MKRLLSPAVAFLFLLLCLPEFSATVIAQTSGTDNPIMIIRCRSFAGQEVFTDTNTKNESKRLIINPCGTGFKLGANGGCIPDCNAVTSSGDNFVYNPETGRCDCESATSESSCTSFCFAELSTPKSKEITSKVDIGCPTQTCPDDAFVSSDEWIYSDDLDECFVTCFEGEIAVEIPKLDCSSPVNGLVPIEICFTSADPINNPLVPGQSVPFADISNCLDDQGNAYLDLLTNTSQGEEYFFSEVVGADGKLCIEFFVDINEPLIINFTNSNLLVIPTCFDDPCGCDKPNIIEGAEVVRFYDELTNLQNLGSAASVRLLSNNNPQGFTDATGSPIAAGTVLAPIVGGEFEYVFYRASGELADIDLEILDVNGDVLNTQEFISSIVCNADDCAIIPTIGQWGLMILALLLSSLGLVFLGRRKVA